MRGISGFLNKFDVGGLPDIRKQADVKVPFTSAAPARVRQGDKRTGQIMRHVRPRGKRAQQKGIGAVAVKATKTQGLDYMVDMLTGAKQMHGHRAVDPNTGNPKFHLAELDKIDALLGIRLITIRRRTTKRHKDIRADGRRKCHRPVHHRLAAHRHRSAGLHRFGY